MLELLLNSSKTQVTLQSHQDWSLAPQRIRPTPTRLVLTVIVPAQEAAKGARGANVGVRKVVLGGRDDWCDQRRPKRRTNETSGLARGGLTTEPAGLVN